MIRQLLCLIVLTVVISNCECNVKEPDSCWVKKMVNGAKYGSAGGASMGAGGWLLSKVGFTAAGVAKGFDNKMLKNVKLFCLVQLNLLKRA